MDYNRKGNIEIGKERKEKETQMEWIGGGVVQVDILVEKIKQNLNIKRDLKF